MLCTADNLAESVTCLDCGWHGTVAETLSYADGVARCRQCCGVLEMDCDPPDIVIDALTQRGGDPIISRNALMRPPNRASA